MLIGPSSCTNRVRASVWAFSLKVSYAPIAAEPLFSMTPLPEGVELPAHEGVIERVVVRRDERAPPVNLAPHGCDIALGQGREVVQPAGAYTPPLVILT